jgi:hypothetical protein
MIYADYVNDTGEYADYVNDTGESVHTIGEKIESLVLPSKGIVLLVNADKPKYMTMSLHQNAGGSKCVKSDYSSFEWIDES